MKHTIDLLIENRALREQLSVYSALLNEAYKHMQLGNIEVASALIEYSLKKENDNDR
nr:hypothetical protein [uncultured Cellulosilyticum sp.]